MSEEVLVLEAAVTRLKKAIASMHECDEYWAKKLQDGDVYQRMLRRVEGILKPHGCPQARWVAAQPSVIRILWENEGACALAMQELAAYSDDEVGRELLKRRSESEVADAP